MKDINLRAPASKQAQSKQAHDNELNDHFTTRDYKMKNLTQLIQDAVSAEQEYRTNESNTTRAAARRGKKLIELQKLLGDAVFSKWVRKIMPMEQCQNFMTLYRERPGYAEYDENANSNELFDIYSELELIEADDDIEVKVRIKAEEDDLSQVQISALIHELEEKKSVNTLKESIYSYIRANSPAVTFAKLSSHIKGFDGDLTLASESRKLITWDKMAFPALLALHELVNEGKIVKYKATIREYLIDAIALDYPLLELVLEVDEKYTEFDLNLVTFDAVEDEDND